MNESVKLFMSIVEDGTLQEQQVRKYLTWGKGNLEQALNYYYRKKEKAGNRSSQFEEKKKESQKNVFTKMRTASVREMQTEKFIKKVKEEYQLPIVGRKSKEGRKSDIGSEGGMESQGEDPQLAAVDYIPQSFAMHQSDEKQEEVYRPSQRKRQMSERQQYQVVQELSGDSMDLNGFKMVQLKDEEEKVNMFRKESQKQQIPLIFSKPKRDLKRQQPSKFGWVQGETEVLLGETILFAFALKFQNDLQIPQGSHIEYRYHIEDDKKKKGFKSKKIEKIMNCRLVYRGSQFGRLKDEQTRILVPLMMHGLIRMQLTAHTIPKRIDYYTGLKVNARVYALKKVITEPVVQTFEGHSDLIVSIYKPVAEEILGLFERLNMKIVTWPLIKRQSKLKSKSISSSINASQVQLVGKSGTERQKELERQRRLQSDPFFKPIQTNLTAMFKSVQKDDSTTRSLKKVQKQPQSAIKKKVLEFRTVDEDKCNQLVDLYQQDLQPYQPGKNFTSTLYPYQALALSWMLKRQGEGEKKEQGSMLHPLWTEYQLPDKRSMFLNELTSQMSLKPPFAKSRCFGGILADEMGLGKTVMMAALLATNKKRQKGKRQGNNLIIVPLTLLSQWQSELQSHTKGTKSIVYYSQQRHKYSQSLQKFDVIITTYGTVSHQFAKGCHVSKTGLYRLKWDRIVLDEAHYIKGRIIQTAKAVYQLEGLHRWCLTGTPIQNGLGDLFSLVHFIRYTPWAEWECWNKYILKPSEDGEQYVFEVLRAILKKVFLRRTKQSKDSEGRPIVQLPSRVSKVQILQMNPKERQYYDSIYENSKMKIEELQKLGILQTKYMQVLEILMRLRQICCHPILYKAVHKFTSKFSDFQRSLRTFIKKRSQFEGEKQGERYFEPLIQGEEEQRVEVTSTKITQTYLRQTLVKIQKSQLQNCLVCLGEVQDPIITSCLHIFCKVCAIRQIEQCNICSACRKKITKQDILHLPRENRFNTSLDGFFPSTKLLALTEHLRKLKPGDKAVVFSQFLGMLDLIEHQLKTEKITFVRMEGSTPHKERTRIVETFQKDPSVQVFVVSLKTAGVGLNLVAANRVFLVDPWWNPGVEEQAIERVHRIGQKRSVEITRFVIDQSIQMRMLQLNSNKKQLSQKVLSQDGVRAEQKAKVQKLKYLMAKY